MRLNLIKARGLPSKCDVTISFYRTQYEVTNLGKRQVSGGRFPRRVIISNFSVPARNDFWGLVIIGHFADSEKT